MSLTVLHQNRPVRTTTRTTGAHIDVRLLPKHAHLIVWGHEHECRIGKLVLVSLSKHFLLAEPEEIGINDLDDTGVLHDAQFITQPGSSVATSLSSEEAGDKKVALLKVAEITRSALKVCTLQVREQQFELKPITLQTTRQFLWQELVLEATSAQLPRDPTNRGTRVWEASALPFFLTVRKRLPYRMRS